MGIAVWIGVIVKALSAIKLKITLELNLTVGLQIISTHKIWALTDVTKNGNLKSVSAAYKEADDNILIYLIKIKLMKN